MKNILKTCFEQTDDIYIDYLSLYMSEAESYKKNYRVSDILKDTEKKYFDYIITTFNQSKITPTEHLFSSIFPETLGQFDSAVVIPINEFRQYMFNLIGFRVNKYIHDVIEELNKRVKSEGLSKEISDEITRLQSLSNLNQVKDISLNIDSRSEYEAMKLRPHGLQTGIRKVDSYIGGINVGTVTTIAGYTGQFKTTWAMNITHFNAYEFGFNTVYISLETPKQDMNWNLLSLHSRYMSAKGIGGKFRFISHEKMRNAELSKEEEDYLFDVVEKDLKSPAVGQDGKLHERGKIIILDESDFSTFSFSEISSVLEKIDEELDAFGGIDALVIDYIQLCKFSGSGYTSDVNSQINAYVTFFRRMSQNLRKKVDSSGKEITRQIAVILLAQLNRTGFQKASRNGGKYDLLALADANELERGSSRVFTTYATEDQKEKQVAQVQIIKNRQGRTMYEPCTVYIEPEAYIFEDEDGSANQTFGGVSSVYAGQESMLSMFSDGDGDLNSLLGGDMSGF